MDEILIKSIQVNKMSETDELITILTFTYSHEGGIARGLLEGAGIKTFLKDDLIVQLQPFYSNAVGGIKLQVLESDFSEAAEILREAGYFPEDISEQRSFYAKLEDATSGLPFLGRMAPEARTLLIVSVIVVIVLVAFIYLAIWLDKNG